MSTLYHNGLKTTRCVLLLTALLASIGEITTASPVSATNHHFQERSLTIRVPIGESFVGGRVLSGKPVTITLRLDNGESKGYGWGYPNADGDFQIPLRPIQGDPESAVTIDAGDIIEIEEFVDDPVIVRVPTFRTTFTEIDQSISGETTPGVHLDAIESLPDGRIVASARVDPSGHFTILLPDGPLGDHPAGWIRSTNDIGHQFFTAWSAVSAEVGIGDNYIIAAGPRRSALQVAIREDSSSVIGREHQSTPPARAFDTLEPTNWSLFFFTDIFGDPIPIVPGDVIQITGNGELLEEIQTFPLSAAINPTVQTISVLTDPGVPVVASIRDGFTREQFEYRTMTGSDGTALIHIRNNEGPLSYNSGGKISAINGRIRMTRNVASTGVTLDLDTGELMGHWSPGGSAQAQLIRGNSVAEDVTTQANENGQYTISLVTGRTQVAAADVLSITLTSMHGAERFELEVPAFEVHVDESGNRVYGSAPSRGVVQAEVVSAFAQSIPHPDMNEVVIGESGQYSMRVDGVPGLLPGSVVRARLLLPSGHVMKRMTSVAQVAVQHGGGLFCGLTQPLVTVDVELWRNGMVFARSSSLADEYGRFRGEFYVGQRRVVLESADTVDFKLGPGVDSTVRAELPVLSADIDWESGQLSLRGEPHRGYEIVGLPSTCYEDPVQGVYSSGMYVRQADENGIVDVIDPFFVRPPWSAVEIVRRDPGAVRVFKVLANPGIEVGRTTMRLGGLATPGTLLSGIIATHAGARGGEFRTTSDSEGGFSIQVPDEDWLLDSSGGVVVLQTDGRSETEVTVGKTEFDFDDEGVVGHTDFGSSVWLRVELSDGTRRETELNVDRDGGFLFERAMLPTRSPWSFNAIRRPAIVVVTDEGHRSVTKVPGWGEVRTPIFLPMLTRNH